MSEEKKIGMSIDCLLHRVRQLEAYLHNLPADSVDCNKVRHQADGPLSAKQALLNHLEVQSAIERLVNSLAELRRQCVKDSAVVSQNKQAKPSNDFACSDLEPPATEISMRKIVRLEKRLKYCWLRSLEYQFLLESFLQNFDPMTECNEDQWNEVSDSHYINGAHLEPHQKRKRLSLDQKNVHVVSTVGTHAAGMETEEPAVENSHGFRSADFCTTYPDVLSTTPISMRLHRSKKSLWNNRDSFLTTPKTNRERGSVMLGRRSGPPGYSLSTQSAHIGCSTRRRKVASRAIATSNKKRAVLRNLDNDRATTGYDSQTSDTSESSPEHHGPEPSVLPSFLCNAKPCIDVDAVFWDDYQAAPYSSDAYSENSIDDNFVSKVTNFGEDYSKILPLNTEFLSFSSLEAFCGETTMMQAKEQGVSLDHIVTSLEVKYPNQRNSSLLRGEVVNKTFPFRRKSEHYEPLINNRINSLSQATKTEQLIHELIVQWRDFHSDLEKRQTCDMLERCANDLLQSIEVTLDSPHAIPHYEQSMPLSTSQSHCTKRISAMMVFEYEEEVKILDSLEEDVKYVIDQMSVQHASECSYCTSTGKVAAIAQRAASYLQSIQTIRQKVTSFIEINSTISPADSLPSAEPATEITEKLVQTEFTGVDCRCHTLSNNDNAGCDKSVRDSQKAFPERRGVRDLVSLPGLFVLCTSGLLLAYFAACLLTPTCCTFSNRYSFFQLSTHGYPPF